MPGSREAGGKTARAHHARRERSASHAQLRDTPSSLRRSETGPLASACLPATPAILTPTYIVQSVTTEQGAAYAPFMLSSPLWGLGGMALGSTRPTRPLPALWIPAIRVCCCVASWLRMHTTLAIPSRGLQRCCACLAAVGMGATLRHVVGSSGAAARGSKGGGNIRNTLDAQWKFKLHPATGCLAHRVKPRAKLATVLARMRVRRVPTLRAHAASWANAPTYLF